MAIKRRDTTDGPRFDVDWRLPDRTKRRKTFKSEREARVFEASIVTRTASGEVVDPRAGRITLTSVYRTWLASRPDLSPKVRRGYEDNWRSRIDPRFGSWHVSAIDHQSIQGWVNEMSESGLGPRTVRWVHSVLKMTLDYAIDEGQVLSRNPAARTKFPPLRQASHTYLSTAEVAALADACGSQGDVVLLLAYTGMRFGELVGLRVEDVDLKARRIRVRRSITQVGGKLLEGNPKSAGGRRSIPVPQRLVPILTDRVSGRSQGAPAITSPAGALLGLENWKRSPGWRAAIVEIGRPKMRVHDLRHTYASLARRAGADLRLLQKTMGHASITVTTNSTLSRRHSTRSTTVRLSSPKVWPYFGPIDHALRIPAGQDFLPKRRPELQ
jgi:integrase